MEFNHVGFSFADSLSADRGGEKRRKKTFSYFSRS